MNWLGNPSRRTAATIEDLSHPPSGGASQLVVLGMVLPLVAWYFGGKAWLTQEATWFGHRNTSLVVQGQTARALAVVFISVGCFCHFRWCWGLIPVYTVFRVGTTVSLLGIVGGILFGVYTMIRHL